MFRRYIASVVDVVRNGYPLTVKNVSQQEYDYLVSLHPEGIRFGVDDWRAWIADVRLEYNPDSHAVEFEHQGKVIRTSRDEPDIAPQLRHWKNRLAGEIGEYRKNQLIW